MVLLGQQALGVPLVAAVLLATGEGPPRGEAVGLSLAAGLAGVVALGSLYRALAVGTMSVVAPIGATGAALPVAVGVATGEVPSAVQGAGLALAGAGVVLAAREGAGAPASRSAVGLALLAALGFGSFYLLSDPAADESVPWLLLLARLASVPVIALVVAGGSGWVAPGRAGWRAIALVGVLDLSATALYAVAQTEGLLAIVPVVASLYPVATVLLARAVLGERLARLQAAGVALAFAGVGLIAVG